jgi:hypothetical protein
MRFTPIDMNMEHELEYDELEEVLDAYVAATIPCNPKPSSIMDDDGYTGPRKCDFDPT